MRTTTLATALLGAAWCTGCSNSGCPNPGGPAMGPADTHCVSDAGTPILQMTSQASCNATGDGGAGAGEYGATMPNASGDDDDCKYHVSWTATALCESSSNVFTVVATNLGDGTPLTGAGMEAEVFLNPTHPSPTPFVESKEGPPGTYVTSPVTFDAPGEWTIRFHFFEQCADVLPSSPHGHAAFFVNVP